jgi:hypothetical protein
MKTVAASCEIHPAQFVVSEVLFGWAVGRSNILEYAWIVVTVTGYKYCEFY